jgi:hypothetical protein
MLIFDSSSVTRDPKMFLEAAPWNSWTLDFGPEDRIPEWESARWSTTIILAGRRQLSWPVI